jgi:hypothetical protein
MPGCIAGSVELLPVTPSPGGREDGRGDTAGHPADAAVVRAHQHAAGARDQPPADVDVEVLAPVKVDTGGEVELQEIHQTRRETSRAIQPRGVGPLPRRVDVEDSPRR